MDQIRSYTFFFRNAERITSIEQKEFGPGGRIVYYRLNRNAPRTSLPDQQRYGTIFMRVSAADRVVKAISARLEAAARASS